MNKITRLRKIEERSRPRPVNPNVISIYVYGDDTDLDALDWSELPGVTVRVLEDGLVVCTHGGRDDERKASASA